MSTIILICYKNILHLEVNNMLSSISRSINKTPLYNSKSYLYEDIEIPTFLQQVCQSKLSSEGVYGIESLIIDDYSEEAVLTPQIYKMNTKNIEKNLNYLKDDLKSAIFYEIDLKNPFFLPLDTKNKINFLNFLKNINLGTIFFQVLFCKRVDNWRDTAISQYTEYLSGNDYPSYYKVIRTFQSKLIKVFRSFDLKRNPIDDIENKILSNGYRFEIRIILFDKNNRNEFENRIRTFLEQISLYNELQLIELKSKKEMINHIFDRRFQIGINNLLSEKEMFCLLTDQTIPKVELPQPVKQQGITKSLEESMLLQRAIQIMPFSENKNVEVDESKAQQINQAFKRVGIVDKPMKVSETYQGSSLLKVQMVIPSNITYTSISKKLVDIQAALGNQNVSIEIGDKPDTINVYVPLENRNILYFRNVLESDEFQNYRKTCPLPIIIGENVNGGYMFADLTKLRHMLVAGATGGGKSIFVNLVILSLLLNVPPDNLMMYLIDPKMVEFTQFKGFPHVREVITDMKKANALLDSLTIEMDNRYEIFSKAGVRDIQGYNELDENNMKYIVCAIDEFADLMMVNKAVEDYVVRLGQKARGAGIHLIIATQRPSVDVITGLIKANMPCRIAFSTTSAVDSKTILDKGGAEKLLGRGDGIAKIEGNRNEFERFQSPVLTLDSKQETKIYEELKKLFADVVVEDDRLPEALVEEPIEKLKKIIANTNETRVSDLQSQMGIAIGKVTDMLKQLVDEGWLRKEGRSYVINVGEDELSKYRE
jgi:S-DNA-T family DNA segregation ATPase FtsK/SpoIIIE